MKKRLLAVLLAAVISVTLGACGSSGAAESDSSSADSEENSGEDSSEDVISLTIGYAPPNTTEVFELAEEYMIKAIEEANASGYFDITLITQSPTGGEANYEEQVKKLENLLAQGCDAIFCSPGNEDACINVFKQINEAGVPLILFNIVEPPEGVEAYIVGFDNYDSSQVEGYAFLDYYGGPGVLGSGEMVDVDEDTVLDLEFWESLYEGFDYSQIEEVDVGIISGIEGTIYTDQRRSGFTDVVTQSENVNIVVDLNGDWDRNTSMSAAENMLQSYDLDAIYAMCSESEMGAASAIANAGKSDSVMLFGNDGTDESVQAVIDGVIVAEVTHGMRAWGWYGVETAVKVCCGIESESFIDINPSIEYAGNAESFLAPEYDPIDWEGIYQQAKS